MKKIFKWIGGILLASMLLTAGLLIHTLYFRPLMASWFYDRMLISFMLRNPELVTSLGILPTWMGSFNSQLGDASPAEEDRMARWAADNLQILQSYDRGKMDQEAKLSYDTMDFFLRTVVDGDHFRADFPINQMFGAQSAIPDFMINQAPLTSKREAEDYIARLTRFGWKFDGVLAGVKQRAARGINPPHFAIVEVIDQMKGFVGKPPEQNPLYVNLADKLGKLPDLQQPDKAALLQLAAAAIKDVVYPAYGRMIDYFTEIEPKFTRDDGAWSLPDGTAYYDWCIKNQTTAAIPAQQLHELGLLEVARIEHEMDRLLRQTGRNDGTIVARLKQMSQDPAMLYSNDDAGRAAILKDYTDILAESLKASESKFNHLPKTQITVKSVPEFSQATAPQAYYQPGDLSGGRGGVFFFNQRDLSETPKWQMRTLAYHEGIPGHHFQISLSMEQKDLPLYRRIAGSFLFTAYVEGWALYAEQLGGEMGLETSPPDALGRLNAEMMRSVRLVVDTGIHAKHWTHDQAIAYMEDHMMIGHDDARSEVERYFVMPGQALAYKVGELKIMELRAKAQRALGDKFDIKAFHDQVLLHGGLALSSLETVIDDWIRASGGTV